VKRGEVYWIKDVPSRISYSEHKLSLMDAVSKAVEGLSCPTCRYPKINGVYVGRSVFTLIETLPFYVTQFNPCDIYSLKDSTDRQFQVGRLSMYDVYVDLDLENDEFRVQSAYDGGFIDGRIVSLKDGVIEGLSPANCVPPIETYL
jgi:hypothetical protein